MVEWKKLGEVCISLNKGTLKQGELIENGKYPVINSGVSLYGRYNEYNNEGNAFTIASRGEYAGFINYSSERFWAGGLCYPYRSNEERLYLTKYLYICLKNYERKIMKTLVSRGSIPAINKTDVDNILIPIPSLEEQERIVSILDTFTASIDNIKAQIEQRRKQYEHYRNTLLTFNKDDDSVEWKTLGEITNISRGKRVVRRNLSESGLIPVFQNSLKPLGFTNESNYPANTTFIISAGAAGDVGYSFSKYWGADDCFSILTDEDLHSRFVYHWLKKNEVYLQSRIRGGAIKRLSRDIINELPFPSIHFPVSKRLSLSLIPLRQA